MLLYETFGIFLIYSQNLFLSALVSIESKISNNEQKGNADL